MEIFVFGSNLAGRHGAGAAKKARFEYNAKYGVGVGPTGRAYAIPTKDYNIQTLPLSEIAPYITDFIAYAKAHPQYQFTVARIGCGLAGYTDDQIAPYFQSVPPNVTLPDGWLKGWYTSSNVLIARGFERYVFGERGTYVEFTHHQLYWPNIQLEDSKRWRLTSDEAYYVELRSKCSSYTMIYFQLKSVWYADYKLRYFYISLADLTRQ